MFVPEEIFFTQVFVLAFFGSQRCERASEHILVKGMFPALGLYYPKVETHPSTCRGENASFAAKDGSAPFILQRWECTFCKKSLEHIFDHPKVGKHILQRKVGMYLS